ncbi:hypothetical protein ROZALSC1DRAFT_29212, partial [Rozella allomycis CSF55]
DFVFGLISLFRASHALVRYGAFLGLYTATKLIKDFLKQNVAYLPFVIVGTGDSDYLTSFLCRQILETMQQEKSLIVSVDKPKNYDERYGGRMRIKSFEELNEKQFEKIIESSPIISMNVLQKMASGMEYLSDSQQINQLKMISLWCKKLTAFEPFLMQSILPFTQVEKMKVQISALQVIQSHQQAFQSCNEEEIKLVWSHLMPLLSKSVNSELLVEILNTVKSIPFNKLTNTYCTQLLKILNKLTFHLNKSVRRTVYELIKEFKGYWKDRNLHSHAYVSLLLSLGEQDKENFNVLIDSLNDYIKLDLKFNNIKMMSDLAWKISENSEITRIVTEDELDMCDYIYDYFLPDSIENIFSNHDNYPTLKLRVEPKRKEDIGFASLLAPLFGISDPVLRMVNLGLYMIKHYFIQHKQWSFQEFSFSFLRMLVRAKAFTMPLTICWGFLENARVCLTEVFSPSLKLEAIRFIRDCLMIVPLAISNKWSELRDTFRSIILDADEMVSTEACNVYSLLFEIVPVNLMESAIQFIKNDLIIMETPVKLSIEEKNVVLKTSLKCLGRNSQKSYAMIIIQILEDYLHDQSSSVRNIAFESIINQMSLIETNYTLLWSLLPFVYDPKLKELYERKLKNEVNFLNRNSYKFDQKDLSDNLRDLILNEIYKIEGDFDLEISINETPVNTLVNNPGNSNDSSHFKIPEIVTPTNLLKEMHRLAMNLKPLEKTNEVLYKMENLNVVKGPVLLAMSEFALSHFESIGSLVLDVLLTKEVDDYFLLAIKNLNENNQKSIKFLISKILSSNFENELILVIFLYEIIKRNIPEKSVDLCSKYIPMINNARFTIKKRLLSILASVQMSLIVGNEEMIKVLDSCHHFIEQVEEEEIVLKVYSSVSKIFDSIGNKHPLFTGVISRMKQDIKSHILSHRKRALAVFKIMSHLMNNEERIWASLLFLSDPEDSISKPIVNILSAKGIIKETVNKVEIDIIHYYRYYSWYNIKVKLVKQEKPLFVLFEDYSFSFENVNSTGVLNNLVSSNLTLTSNLLDNLINSIDEAIEKKDNDLNKYSTIITLKDPMNYVEKMIKMAVHCRTESNQIRQHLFQAMEDSFFFFNEFVDIPVLDEEQFEILEAFKSESMNATNDMVKNNKTEKMNLIIQTRKELDESIDDKAEILRKFTLLEARLTKELGSLFVLSQEKTILALEFFDQSINNDHRDIREAAVDAIISIAKTHKANPSVWKKIQSLLENYTELLYHQKQNLYYKKMDILNLVSNLLIYSTNESLCQRAVQCITDLWKDPDSQIRSFSITQIKNLGIAGVKQVLDSFDDKQPNNLVKISATLLNNHSFTEKDQLNDLLQWYFTRNKK